MQLPSFDIFSQEKKRKRKKITQDQRYKNIISMKAIIISPPKKPKYDTDFPPPNVQISIGRLDQVCRVETPDPICVPNYQNVHHY